MRKILVQALAIPAALALAAAPAAAQSGVTFGVGGGVSVPLGDFADENVGGAELGWAAQASLGFQGGANLPVGFRIDGMIQRFSINEDFGEVIEDFNADYQLISGTANVVYAFQSSPTSTFRPYLIGGAGIYNLDLKGDDADGLGFEGVTKFGLNGGAGFNFAAGNIGLFIEGRFHNVFTEGSNTNFIPIMLGVRFGSDMAD